MASSPLASSTERGHHIGHRRSQQVNDSDPGSLDRAVVAFVNLTAKESRDQKPALRCLSLRGRFLPEPVRGLATGLRLETLRGVVGFGHHHDPSQYAPSRSALLSE